MSVHHENCAFPLGYSCTCEACEAIDREAATLPDMPTPTEVAAEDSDRWHYVELDLEYMSERFVCEAPEGSACRSLPTCQHIGGRCSDYEGNHAHACTDRTPVDTGDCLIYDWIENSDECGRGKYRIPVATTWEGDFYTYAPREVADHEGGAA